MKAPIIIYHANCNDGFTAAWVAYKALVEADADRNWWGGLIELRPVQYGDPVPDISGRSVYILDFAFPRHVMLHIMEHADQVTWLDHHATAIADCGDLLNDERMMGKVDIDRCGAWLAWEWFRGNAVPDIVKLVDDRDRSVFQYPQTRFMHQGLNLRQYTIDDWDYAAANVQEVVAQGQPLEEAHWAGIRAALDAATETKLIAGTPVPCCKMEYRSASDSCHELLARFPAAKFAATYFDKEDGLRQYSLRSRRGSDVDVSAVAKQFGGGGHKHAAGFTVVAELDNGPLNP